ncbi:MAG: ribosome maturation factor RimP [FCB group bacterium]|nr:ribosome maturation factor RimP [FCB group bacterium]
MNNDETIRRGWRELEPLLWEQGYELVELELAMFGGRRILRVFIDKEGGITLGDCQAVSQILNPYLDSSDLVEGSYSLEVSSPGFDRPVRKLGDFERFAGERINVKTAMPVEGKKKFKGILKGLKDGLVVVESEGRVYEIHLENLLRANLDR